MRMKYERIYVFLKAKYTADSTLPHFIAYHKTRKTVTVIVNTLLNVYRPIQITLFSIKMSTLFNDPAAFRESNQWRAVFATPSMNDNQSQIFSNFGSISDQMQNTQDFSALVAKITSQFAMDVFAELRNDIMQASSRSSKTSQGIRDQPSKVITPQRTPGVITPHNPRRTSGYRGSTPIHDQIITF